MKQTVNGYEREMQFQSGHDCIRFECAFGSARCKPGAGGSHGKGTVTMLASVKGDLGAVSFSLYTGWEVETDYSSHSDYISIMPADLGYHARDSQYEGQTVKESCHFLDGQSCYYEGSNLNAYGPYRILTGHSEEAFWKFLEEYYLSVFHGQPYPEVPKFPYNSR